MSEKELNYDQYEKILAKKLKQEFKNSLGVDDISFILDLMEEVFHFGFEKGSESGKIFGHALGYDNAIKDQQERLEKEGI